MCKYCIPPVNPPIDSLIVDKGKYEEGSEYTERSENEQKCFGAYQDIERPEGKPHTHIEG